MKRIIILAFAAALLISACRKEAPVPQTVTVTLKSNPTTGYSWQVSSLKLLLVAAFIPKIAFIAPKSDYPVARKKTVEYNTPVKERILLARIKKEYD